MAVLVTAIHAYGWRKEGVDDRAEPAHDDPP
jgi:hypothetical protein